MREAAKQGIGVYLRKRHEGERYGSVDAMLSRFHEMRHINDIAKYKIQYIGEL